MAFRFNNGTAGAVRDIAIGIGSIVTVIAAFVGLLAISGYASMAMGLPKTMNGFVTFNPGTSEFVKICTYGIELITALILVGASLLILGAFMAVIGKAVRTRIDDEAIKHEA